MIREVPSTVSMAQITPLRDVGARTVLVLRVTSPTDCIAFGSVATRPSSDRVSGPGSEIAKKRSDPREGTALSRQMFMPATQEILGVVPVMSIVVDCFEKSMDEMRLGLRREGSIKYRIWTGERSCQDRSTGARNWLSYLA